MRDISKVTLSLAVATALSLGISGCGSSSSDTPVIENEENIQNDDAQNEIPEVVNNLDTGVVTGNAIDGYIRNALVCLDVNRNNECNDDEPFSKTTSTGTYSLDLSDYEAADLTNAQVLVTGGIDNDTGAAFAGILKAPFKEEGEVHVTPITTIVADILKENNVTNSELNTTTVKVAQSLGIDAEDVDSDYVKTQDENTTNTDVMKVALQLQKTLEIMAQALETNNEKSAEEAMSDAIKGLAQQLKDGDSNITTAITEYATEANITDNIVNAAKDVTTAIENAMSVVATGTAVESAVMIVDKQKELVKTKVKDKESGVITVETTFLLINENTLHLKRLLGLAEIDLNSTTLDTLTSQITDITSTTTLEELKTKITALTALNDATKASLLSQIDVAMLKEMVVVDTTHKIKEVFEVGSLDFQINDNNGFFTLESHELVLTDSRVDKINLYYNPATKTFEEHADDGDSNDITYTWRDGNWEESNESMAYNDDGSILYFVKNNRKNAEVTLIAKNDISSKNINLYVWDSNSLYTVH